MNVTSSTGTPFPAETPSPAPGETEIRARAVPACRLCGAPGAVVLAGVADRIAGAPGRWDIRRCATCHFAWLDPLPIPEDIPLLYQGEYYTRHAPATAPPQGRRAALDAAVRRRVLGYAAVSVPGGAAGLTARLLSFVPPLRELAVMDLLGLGAHRRGRLLDIGCGSGDFLARMHALGWSVQGLEPDPEAARLAAQRHGLDVRTGTLPHPDFQAGTLDVVTLHHVIEHLHDPEATLREARRLLVPGGLLALATPNIDSLGAKAFGAAWLHWDPPRHLHLFSPRSLAILLERAGFEIVTLLTPTRQARWSFGASSRIRSHGAFPSANQALLSTAETLGGVAFHALAALLPGRARLGEEVFALARRPANG
jgi:2-polyprenyl-3-methyl-5-hydroxy-6-metoxy-1,4-benzoquinol methylase